MRFSRGFFKQLQKYPSANKNTRPRNHVILLKTLNSATEKFAVPNFHHTVAAKIKQVSVRPNKLFSLSPIDEVMCTNELHSKPACYIHGPTHDHNLLQAKTSNSVMKRG